LTTKIGKKNILYNFINTPSDGQDIQQEDQEGDYQTFLFSKAS